MRRAALLVALALLLAGCSGLAPTDDAGTETTPTATATPANGTDDPSAETSTSNDTAIVHTERADPETDRLGWEDGYWHDDPINVTPEDGLNATERDRAISRAMARVEYVRGLEFEASVNVSVISRSNFSSGDSGNASPAFQRFDNAKFEALYLIGTQNDSLSTQEDTRDQSVAGFYSPARGNIVLVSDAASPQFDGERTLAHELQHALQDQHFNLSNRDVETRDAYNGRNGLVEGDARAVELDYLDRCGETWNCLPSAQQNASQSNESESSGPGIHLGVYILEYFPYSDGVGFVRSLKSGGGWDAVNDAFDAPPSSSTSVIYPERYGEFEPEQVTLEDRTSNGWERVVPPGRASYATLGQSALTAMFAYTLYDDYNESAVVSPLDFLNLKDGSGVNRTDPFNYDLPAHRGWAGDRMHVYQRGNESGYVWRLSWDSSADAQRFADNYESLVAHWGGTQQAEGHWEIPTDSPYTGAVGVTVDGDTVTIVRGPSAASLDNIHGGAG
jgi:hypothetical protein